MAEEKKLVMTFDPHTIEHLGIKMYSFLPNAIAELIANAYDAEAKNVYIDIDDTDSKKSISVTDDGIGMSFEEINEKFLKIGRKRRSEENEKSKNGLRKVTGRKGLGKLAFFGIGNTITIETVQDGKCVRFTLNWDELINSEERYEPTFNISDCHGKTGTKIVLSELKRKTSIDKLSLAISLSKLFNFFDVGFQVFISLNGDEKMKIDNELRYKSLSKQFQWAIPDDSPTDTVYFKRNNISGKIFATEKPLKPDLRGITLFAHGRLVNAPEFFGVGESSHGYSYFTGWLDVDFVDEQEEDVISTDRQSLSWDLPLTEDLRKALQQLLHSVERDWREKRKTERTKAISRKTNIDISSWYTTLPVDVRKNVEHIVSNVVDNSELETDTQNQIVNDLHTLIPEYPRYHWRHLHDEIKSAARKEYENKDYYRAIQEALKRYEASVKKKSGIDKSGQPLMQKAFGSDDDKLKVTKKYRKKDGSSFDSATIKDIEDSQRELSAGIFAGVRNPISHEEIQELQAVDLLSEMDCLDSLSLLSFLFRRLDNAEKS